MSAAWLHTLLEYVPLLKLDTELEAVALIWRITLSCEELPLEMGFVSCIRYPDSVEVVGVAMVSTRSITVLKSCNEAHKASEDIDLT